MQENEVVDLTKGFQKLFESWFVRMFCIIMAMAIVFLAVEAGNEQPRHPVQTAVTDPE